MQIHQLSVVLMRDEPLEGMGMGLLDFFSRPRYDIMFQDYLKQIGASCGVEIRVSPNAANAIIQSQLEGVRRMKRYGLSGPRFLGGGRVEDSFVREAALMTAYVIAGKGMTASEAESEPVLSAIGRDTARALLDNESNLSDDARDRIARIIERSF